MIVPDTKLGEWDESSWKVSLLEELRELAGLVRLNCLKQELEADFLFITQDCDWESMLY